MIKLQPPPMSERTSPAAGAQFLDAKTGDQNPARRARSQRPPSHRTGLHSSGERKFLMRRQTREPGLVPSRDRPQRHVWGTKSPHSGAINAQSLMKVSTQGLGGGRTRARTWDPMIKSSI